jgi:subtilisin family serine protease
MYSLNRMAVIAAGVLLACNFVFASAMAAPGGAASERVIVAFKAGKGPAVKAALQGMGAAIHYEFPALRGFAATLPAAAVKGLARNPNIDYVEPDVRRYAMAESTPYGIPMVQADQAQPAKWPDLLKTVCIIDSGYSIQHEDLPPDNNSNSTVTGYDDGNLAWDEDGDGHGTHVAGTVAAVSNNGVGVVGVIGQVNLYIVRVFGNDGLWAYSSSLVDALGRCEAGGADVINMSLGGGPKSRFEERAFADAESRGVLSVASAGNDGNTRKNYPASYNSIISVAAVDSAEVVADFSQKNSAVELAAPGVTVRSTVPMRTGTNERATVNGTDYEVVGMEGSPPTDPNNHPTGPLVRCGFGTSDCPGGSGQVCLIQRGDITFAEKVLACENGGGVAAIIYNNADGLFSGTLGGTVTNIPSVGMSKSDGATLEALITNSLSDPSAIVATPEGHYAFFDGTSMAAPHVSGVAALVWSNHPDCTNAEIRNALAMTAKDKGDSGRDNAYGFGIVQAKAAVDYLALPANSCGGGGDDGGGDGGDGGGGGGGGNDKPCNPNSPRCNP